jgi:hypothetical protein
MPGGTLNHHLIIARLQVNGEIFERLFQNLTDEQARWKPAPERWSLLEVVNHLYDEEREDFRRRLALVLENPRTEWPPIDPEGWVLERGYNRRNVDESLQNFFAERTKSIEWLNTVQAPDWKAAHHHPKMGPLSAELLLANWLAHDLFHFRQVIDLHFDFLRRQTAPLSLEYSGWP